MKTNLTLLLLIIVMVSCQLKKSDNTETAVAEATEIDNTEDCTADTVKATAIFWIDKAETKHCKEYGFRTIKAKFKCRKRCLKADMCSPENNLCSFAAYGEC